MFAKLINYSLDGDFGTIWKFPASRNHQYIVKNTYTASIKNSSRTGRRPTIVDRRLL